MRATVIFGLLSFLLAAPGSADSVSGGNGSDVHLTLRKRIQPFGASDMWAEANFEQSFMPAKTAIVITDMWDKHWCRGATERVGQIAMRMEPLLERASASGI